MCGARSSTETVPERCAGCGKIGCGSLPCLIVAETPSAQNDESVRQVGTFFWVVRDHDTGMAGLFEVAQLPTQRRAGRLV